MTSNSSFAAEHSPHQPWIPLGSVIGIGSLPHRDPWQAVQFVAEYCPEIPFWPQLCARNPTEGIIEQGLLGIADLLESRPQSYGYAVKQGRRSALLSRLYQGPATLDTTRAAGFFCFERALADGLFANAIALKGQIEGPVTLGYHLFHHDQPLILYGHFLSALGDYIARLAAWQVTRLRRWQRPVLLFIDEPMLTVIGASGLSRWRAPQAALIIATLRRVCEVIRDAGALAGIHCCAPPPFSILCRASPDIISFDAYQYLERFNQDDDTQRFLEAGGLIAFGLVPTLKEPQLDLAEELFHHWVVNLSHRKDLSHLARQALVSATCGLGLLDTDSARRNFQIARMLSRRFRELATNKKRPMQ
jgi:hypothetical protein